MLRQTYTTLLLASALLPYIMAIVTSFDLQHRVDTQSASIISKPGKRLMGIFRCNGWGPGCTQIDGVSSLHDSDTGGGGSSGGRHRGTTGTGGRNYVPYSSGGRFQPFFTLTSGGSWGPTGKRSAQSMQQDLRNQDQHIRDFAELREMRQRLLQAYRSILSQKFPDQSLANYLEAQLNRYRIHRSAFMDIFKGRRR